MIFQIHRNRVSLCVLSGSHLWFDTFSYLPKKLADCFISYAVWGKFIDSVVNSLSWRNFFHVRNSPIIFCAKISEQLRKIMGCQPYLLSLNDSRICAMSGITFTGERVTICSWKESRLVSKRFFTLFSSYCLLRCIWVSLPRIITRQRDSWIVLTANRIRTQSRIDRLFANWRIHFTNLIWTKLRQLFPTTM